MSQTPRTNEAQFGTGRVSVAFAQQLERELNEANTDRLRLRDALTQAGAGQFLNTISATPPPAVVAKADADALADALEEIVKRQYLGDNAITEIANEALETYRAKYP